MKEILFHKYELLRPLGEGGMGKIYLARDLHLDKMVVIKEGGENFLDLEAGLLKELEHPGLPGIYDCIREQGRAFLVMEYVQGMNLRQYLEKHGRVSEKLALEWMQELCRIFEYLHSRHPAVVYRDLKPENIMIRQDGRIKLIDFGGALRCSRDDSREELCVGTAGYSPPEQWKGTRGDITWDIYGLGVVLHEMLTGANPARPPYAMRPVGEYDRSLPAALDRIIRKAAARDAADRYQTAQQMEKDLQAIFSGRPFREYLSGAGRLIRILACGYTAACFLSPLLKGIPADQIPFPYLEKPLVSLMITLILHLISLGFSGKNNCLLRQEKNIWLTEKQFSGLFSMLFALLAGSFFLGGVFSGLPAPYTVQAEQKQKELWVEMRDDQGRKMLLKNDAVYRTEDRVQFEIPASRLPEQKLAMQIVAVGEDGQRYESRIFYIQAQDSVEEERRMPAG